MANPNNFKIGLSICFCHFLEKKKNKKKNLSPPWKISLPNEVLVKLASLASLETFGVSVGYLFGLYLLRLLTWDCFFPLLWGLLALKSGLKSSCNSFVSLSLWCTKGTSAWQVCYKCSEFNEQDNKIGTNRILIISWKLIMIMNNDNEYLQLKLEIFLQFS